MAKSLVWVEHDNASVKDATLAAVTAASQLGEVHLLVAGSGCAGVADAAAKIAGVGKVHLADNAAYKDALPENVAPLVVWLGSPESAHVTGKMFESQGGRISIGDGWRTDATRDKGARWDVAELGPVIDQLLEQATPAQKVWGS